MTTRRGAIATTAIVVAAIGLGMYVGTATLSLSTPSARPSLALASPPTPRPTPNPSPVTGPDGLTVYPLGTIPEDSRIVVSGDAGDERLLLLDVANRRVRLLAHFDGFGAFKEGRVIELTSNSSGLLVICLRSAGPLARLYYVRPGTGDIRSYTIPTAENPRLSPDGATLAVSRNALADQKGLWLLNTSDGTGRRITTDVGRRATRAVQWSADGSRLSALLDQLNFTRELVVVGIDGTVSASLGTAADARWRGEDLYFWTFLAPGPVSLLHAGAVSNVYLPPPGTTISFNELRPRSKDLAMRLSTQTTTPRLVLYDGATGATTQLVADATWVIALWWSADATKLYAWILDKDTTFVREVFSGEDVLTFCFRNKIDPPCGG